MAYQLPNDRTRVTYLLDSIRCTDPELLAAVAAVKNDDAGMRDAFELTATSISPADPVARKRMNNKRPAAEISATEGLQSKGKTGVELRWHKTPEFKALPENQREELKAWCATRSDNRHSSKKQNPGKNGKTPITQGSNKYKKMIKRQVAAMLGKSKPKNDNALDVDGIVSAIKAMTQASAEVSAAVAAVPAVKKSVAEIAEVQLRSILGRSKLG